MNIVGVQAASHCCFGLNRCHRDGDTRCRTRRSGVGQCGASFAAPRPWQSPQCVEWPKVKGRLFAPSGPSYTGTNETRVSLRLTSRQSTSNVYVSSVGASNEPQEDRHYSNPHTALASPFSGQCPAAHADRSEACSDQLWNMSRRPVTIGKARVDAR